MDPSKMETGLDVCHAKEYYGHRITYLRAVYINIDLNLYMTKGYWCLVCDWCNLIHDNICRVYDCRTISNYMINLSFFENDTLSGMTKEW